MTKIKKVLLAHQLRAEELVPQVARQGGSLSLQEVWLLVNLRLGLDLRSFQRVVAHGHLLHRLGEEDSGVVDLLRPTADRTELAELDSVEILAASTTAVPVAACAGESAGGRAEGD